MPLRFLLILLAAGILAGKVHGQNERLPLEPRFQPQFRIPFHNRKTEKNFPLPTLPSRLDYEDGKVSLVPDFEESGGGEVSVYLINDRTDAFRLETVALELPIVLEARLGEDHWERAEPQNAFGFLSTSKIDSVPPGHFRMKQVTHWEEGREATLRYSLYQNGKPTLVSAPFEGRLPLGEIDRARHDLMSASQVPDPLRIRYTPGQTDIGDAREWLGKLELLRFLGPCHVDVDEAQKWVSFVHESPVSTGLERDVAIALQMELLRPWPNGFDLYRLLTRCHEVIGSDSGDFIGSQRALCWAVLGDHAATAKKPLHHPELAELAWKAIQNDELDHEERSEAVGFLCVKYVVENESPISGVGDRRELLKGSNPYLRIVAANWLLSRVERSAVVDFYLENEGEVGAYELVQVLQFDRVFSPYHSPEWTLWDRALDKDMAYSAEELLSLYHGDDAPDRFEKVPRSIRDRLEAYFQDLPDGSKSELVRRLFDQPSSRSSRIELFRGGFPDPFGNDRMNR